MRHLTPSELLRLSHQQPCNVSSRPWARDTFRHPTPRAGGPDSPSHLLYEAVLIYPGTVAVSLGGETVAASRPGLLDVPEDYGPSPCDPYTHSEREKLVAKAAGLLLQQIRHVHIWWPIRSSNATNRRVIAHGVVRQRGAEVTVMVVHPSCSPGPDQVLAVAVPGRPLVVDEVATAAAHAAAVNNRGGTI